MSDDDYTPTKALAECRDSVPADVLRELDARCDRIISPYKSNEQGKVFLNYLLLRLAAHCERDEI